MKCLSLRRPDSTKLKLKKVLGKGGFCVAFTATVKETQKEKVGVVVKKPIIPLSKSLEEIQISLSQLVLENEALRAFASTSCEFLPRLYNAQWEVSNDFSYIVSQPEGLSLPYYAAMLRKKERKKQMVILYQNMIQGLDAAYNAGYCHTDLRPDNVIVVGKTFVIIDWGLATKPNSRFHEHRAGIDYYHDEIVCKEVENAPLFKTEFDKFSAKCVTYFFAEKRTPWSKFLEQDDDTSNFLAERIKCLGTYDF